MTDEELNIKVAEIAGWERGPRTKTRYGDFLLSAMSCWHKKTDKDGWQDNLPDFVHDLNAMHEAEKTLLM